VLRWEEERRVRRGREEVGELLGGTVELEECLAGQIAAGFGPAMRSSPRLDERRWWLVRGKEREKEMVTACGSWQIGDGSMHFIGHRG
jgi:hypothetical protein